MNNLFLIAWRNLWRNKRRTYITLSSIVFAVLIAALMRGLQRGSYEKMLGDAVRSSTGHVQLMGKGYWDEKSLSNSFEAFDGWDSAFNADPNVEFIAPTIESGCLASSGNYTRAIFVKGVDPDAENVQSGLANKIEKGRYLSERSEGILLGWLIS